MFDSDVLILTLLIGIIVIIGTVCIILTIRGDKKYKEKQMKSVKEKEEVKSKPDIQIALATDNIPTLDDKKESEMITEVEPVYEVIDDMDDISSEPVTIDEEPVSVKEDVEFLFDEPVKETKTDISDVLSEMQRDLEKQKYEKIDRYEEDQEENAVISYQELLDRKMALKDEPVREVIKETRSEKTEPTYEWNDTPKHFSNSEFVSPIFGRQDSSNNYPTVKKTEVREEIKTTYLDNDDVSKETVDLLKELREYRNNR